MTMQNTRLLLIFAACFALTACNESRIDESGGETSKPDQETPATEPSHIPGETLRSMIKVAHDLAPAGDAIWPGYAAAPFGVLLIEENVETLFCHDGPAADFTDYGVDPVTGCVMKGRARTFDTNLLAAFPAVDGISTIVIGTPEATGQDPLEWQVTLLHEHFHQMQTSQPGYYERVNALDLSGGDQSGMWMLNYPFPYDSAETGEAFNRLAQTLTAAIESIGTAGETAAVENYAEARAALRATVSDADWRYFEFQLWQEGVARWTEIAIAASVSSQPELQQAADNKRKGVMNSLKAVQEQGLKTWKRSAFYPVGAAEAMLLNARDEAWRTRYFYEPFALEPYFETVNTP
jgi:hypothetical protein